MSARDDLAADLIAADETYGQRARPPWDEIADHLIDQGWSRPRVVTTAAELDALPAGSVIVTAIGGQPAKKWRDGWRLAGIGHGPTRIAPVVSMSGQPSSWLVVWSPPAETDGTER